MNWADFITKRLEKICHVTVSITPDVNYHGGMLTLFPKKKIFYLNGVLLIKRISAFSYYVVDRSSYA